MFIDKNPYCTLFIDNVYCTRIRITSYNGVPSDLLKNKDSLDSIFLHSLLQELHLLDTLTSYRMHHCYCGLPITRGSGRAPPSAEPKARTFTFTHLAFSYNWSTRRSAEDAVRVSSLRLSSWARSATGAARPLQRPPRIGPGRRGARRRSSRRSSRSAGPATRVGVLSCLFVACLTPTSI